MFFKGINSRIVVIFLLISIFLSIISYILKENSPLDEGFVWFWKEVIKSILTLIIVGFIGFLFINLIIQPKFQPYLSHLGKVIGAGAYHNQYLLNTIWMGEPSLQYTDEDIIHLTNETLTPFLIVNWGDVPLLLDYYMIFETDKKTGEKRNNIQYSNNIRFYDGEGNDKLPLRILFPKEKEVVYTKLDDYFNKKSDLTLIQFCFSYHPLDKYYNQNVYKTNLSCTTNMLVKFE